MDYDEGKDKLVEALKKKKKTKFYFSDLQKILGLKPRAAKKIINRMVQEQILEYWSSGSTTMYGLTGAGVQSDAEGENEEE